MNDEERWTHGLKRSERPDHADGRGDRQADQSAGGGVPPSEGWSIRRAIELLDEAIDRAGEQLARAAGASLTWQEEVPSSQPQRSGTRAGRRFAAVESEPAFDVEHQAPLHLRELEL
jgi:hypothetical protein